MSLRTDLRAPARRPPTVVSWLLIAAGAVVVLAAVTITAMRWAMLQVAGSQTLSADTQAMGALDAQVDAGSLTVTYADGDRAVLRVTGGSGWTMRRDGTTLRVKGPGPRPFGWPWGNGGSHAVLTLPYGVETADYDATATVGAGDLTLSGEYRKLTVRLDSGSARVAASASTATAEVDAGDATLDLSGVTTASLTVDAGTLDGTITGDQPDRVSVDVDSGDADITLPAGAYAVTTDTSAGDVADHLTRDTASPNRVDVQVSAGSVTLR